MKHCNLIPSQLTSILWFSLLSPVILCTTTLRAQPGVVDKFESRSHTFDGRTIRYALFVPEEYDASLAYPLVLALHGSGEGACTNNCHLKKNRIATAWADPSNQMDWPAFVVAPQIPPCSNCAAEAATVIDLLDSLAVEFSVDENRLYVTGWSFGGFGAFYFISHFPDRFAAAIPLRGRGETALASRFHNVSLWAFHGEMDPSVPAHASREMISAAEADGRRAVYTHCDRWDCIPLPDSLLSNALERHANLLYTEFPELGTDIVDRSLDYPRLFPWVFSQYRAVPNAIHITTPSGYPALAGTSQINWTAVNPTDSVEFWISVDNGESFKLVEAAVPNTGSYGLNTVHFADTPFASLQLFLRNAQGFVYGRQTSDEFIIDNPGPGTPFIRIDDAPFLPRRPIDAHTLDLRFLATDPESNALNADLLLSTDGGVTFARVASFDVESDTAHQTMTLDLEALPNSSAAVLRLEVSDEHTTAGDNSRSFLKHTPRAASTNVEHVAGHGDASITLHFVYPAQLTGHRYRITFDDADPANKTYSVADLQTGATSLDDARMPDGILESALFDGVRLVVQDVEEVVVDLETTGWTQGNSNLSVSIDAPVINQGPAIPALVFLATPTDYRLEIASTVIDTSVTGTGFTARPMQFTMKNLLTAQRSEVQFNDRDEDGLPSPGDYLNVLEPNDAGVAAPAWRFRFRGDANTVAPVAGDIFLMQTLKPVTADDVYEFQAVVGTAREMEIQIPTEFRLLQSYPNPFNRLARIQYAVPVATHVRLTVYDLLGREVAELVNGHVSEGKHSAVWNAQQMGSGVYFYRLEAGDYTEAKSLVVAR